MPHCLWIHQRLAVIRSAETGGIDGDYVRGGREVRPSRLEGVYAFGPRAHQDRVGTTLAAFGVADRQSVNLDCLRVNQCAHWTLLVYLADSRRLVHVHFLIERAAWVYLLAIGYLSMRQRAIRRALKTQCSSST